MHQLAAPGAVRPRVVAGLPGRRAGRDRRPHAGVLVRARRSTGVRRATKERAIDYPVAVDNDYEIWSAFDNHYWPALYFVDADGIIRDHHFGEGRYEESERDHPAAARRRARARLRRRARRRGGGRLGPPADARDVPRLRARRALRLARAAPRSTSAAPTSSPSACASTTGRSPASGRSGVRRSCSRRPAGASPTASTRATRTSCCLPERESRFPSACSSTARPRAGRTAWTSTRTGTACSGTAACTSSCASSDDGPRADAGDHVPRARRRGVRVHVRVAG